VLVACFCSACLLTWLSYGQCCASTYSREANYHVPQADPDALPAVAIVVASQLGDDNNWLEAFPDWSKFVYATNDHTADLKVPKDNGREGMAYLTQVYCS
jgi:hypothetical protein